MELRAEIKGLGELQNTMTKTLEAVRKGTEAGMLETMTRVGERADAIVPFDEGTLSSSQVMDRPRAGGGAVKGKIGYGHGPSQPYALYQHERTDLAHPGGRQAKFLETPAKVIGLSMGNIIAKHLKGLL
jgi:hypothetical protein